MQNKKVGILITNVGTPDEPEEEAVRLYLAEFLSDQNVIDYPRWLWMPLLNKVILKRRPARSAALYQNIWLPDGSPLLLAMESIASKLERKLNTSTSTEYQVEIGMRYGNPSLELGLEILNNPDIDELIIFPLYPQFSISTTGTTLDQVSKILINYDRIPKLRIIEDYHHYPEYIHGLCQIIKDFWEEESRAEKLLLSFHGVPQRYTKFDDYQQQCFRTAELVVKNLALKPREWEVSFQSRFGPEPWLQPYTDEILEKWGKSGVESVSVIAPGFSVDCLETIDELGREGKDIFIEAGGKKFHYIPALNDKDTHITLLSSVILNRHI